MSRFRSALPVAIAVIGTWCLTTVSSAQSSIPNGVFVRNSEGLLWLVLDGQRVKIPVWPASDEEIAALPVADRWAVMNADGAIVAGDRPAWLTDATPPSVPTSLPSAPTVQAGPTFGSGTKVVGTDVQPGTYRSNNPGDGCYWARLKGLGGSTSDILANDNALGPAVVTILPTDAGFTSSRCATWMLVSGPVTAAPDAPFGNGTWIVGSDIAPGLWRADGSERCYWERARDFGGGTGSIIANENPRGSAVVQIAPSDKAFKTKGCGTWKKAN